MKKLEFWGENFEKNGNFLDRKISLCEGKTLLKGGTKVGKTTLAKQFLSRFDAPFYFNFNDIRNEGVSLKKAVEFVKLSKFDAVCLDGVAGVEENEPLLQQLSCQNLVVITQERQAGLQGFESVELFGLDYEEFIAFFAKNYDAKTLFTQFMKRGNLPNFALLDLAKTASLQELLRANFSPNELSVLQLLATQIDATLNAYQIYEELKSRAKISKSFVYATLQKAQTNYLLALLPSFEGGKAKPYFYNFALKNALSLHKNPKSLIKNMLFCELVGFDEVFFTKELDFFIPQEKIAVKVEPFLDEGFVKLWFKKNLAHFKKLDLSRVVVVSNFGEGEFESEGVRCEISSFWGFLASL